RWYKWVKRNKRLAITIHTIKLTLLVGIGVSLYFWYEAEKQKKEAEDAAGREKLAAEQAEKDKQAAISARNELKQTNDELLQSQEQVKRTLAKALLGPVTTKDSNDPLTPLEVEAFWQLTELRRDEVARMFLEEATRTPLACEQLECRAEYAFHAAIGLDRE